MNDLVITPELRWCLAAAMILYVVAMYALSFWVRGRIQSAEDFVVAGRRLPLGLAWATLLATWFGAGTMLTVADEVRHEGVRRAALDPFGAGFCLILAGLFFAGPLWKMGLLTVSDFFRRRFGTAAELLSAAILVPSYFGWIAAQLVAVAAMLELFFGLNLAAGIFLVAMVGMGYTLLGGMWSVTLTDAVQVALLLVGLVLLAGKALAQLGGGPVGLGFTRLVAETPPELLNPIPRESLAELAGWLSVFCVGALGNLPGQDLLQRVFAARSAAVARGACLLAGVAYLTFGLIPVMLGLVARLVLPEETQASILPAMAHFFMEPLFAVIFTVALLSAVLSTIDSAILSPASVLAQNVFGKFNLGVSPLAANRIAVVFVTAASLAMAYAGENAYSLLEDAYELPLVGMFVPLALGLFRAPRGEAPAVAAMVTGASLWTVHYVMGWDAFLEPWLSGFGWRLPGALTITACSLIAYLAGEACVVRRPGLCSRLPLVIV